jgi:RelB Antitoxin alpha helical domain
VPQPGHCLQNAGPRTIKDAEGGLSTGDAGYPKSVFGGCAPTGTALECFLHVLPLHEHLAIGDTPNIASCLQGLAGPDTVAKAYEGRNVEAFIDEGKIKQLFKEALVEVIEERKEVFYELLTEVLEDIALVRAIQEGEDTEPVSKDEVLKILEDAV